MPTKHSTRFAASVALAMLGCLAVVFPSAARADQPSQVEVFGGAQGDYSNFGYLGATFSLSKLGIGNGPAIRALADIGGYDYISDKLGVVRANFSGGEIDGVYQFSGHSYWADVYAGANYTYTNMIPEDFGNALLGRQYELRLGSDGGFTSGGWRTDWTGYYGTRLSDYAARLGFTHAISPGARLGLEGYTEGNPNYHLNQFGPYAGLGLTQRGEIQVSGGWSWESGFNSRAYVRASFYERL